VTCNVFSWTSGSKKERRSGGDCSIFRRTNQRPSSAATVNGPFLKVNSPVSSQTYVPTRFFESKVSSRVTTIKLCSDTPNSSYMSLTSVILPLPSSPTTAKCLNYCVSICWRAWSIFCDRYLLLKCPFLLGV
jgi:hypothetical protein